MCEPKHRPFKVWNKERDVKTVLTVSSLEELKTKGCEKLQIDPPVRVVHEEDGTEIDDEEYFSFLPDFSILMLLPGRSEWMPPHTCIKSLDHPDGAVDTGIVLECGSAESDLSSIIEKMKNEFLSTIYFSGDEMQQLVDADTEGLAQILGKSTKVIKSLQEFCQRQIDEQEDYKEMKELFHFCSKNESTQDQNSVTGKRKRNN